MRDHADAMGWGYRAFEAILNGRRIGDVKFAWLFAQSLGIEYYAVAPLLLRLQLQLEARRQSRPKGRRHATERAEKALMARSGTHPTSDAPLV